MNNKVILGFVDRKDSEIKDPKLPIEHTLETDQTGWMPMLIYVFTWRRAQNVGFCSSTYYHHHHYRHLDLTCGGRNIIDISGLPSR